MIFILLIIPIILIIIIILSSITTIIMIENTSMLPTLKNGDKVLVLRRFFSFLIKKKSIVIFRSTIIRENNKIIYQTALYIKRIVALEGEIITTSIDEIPEYIRYQTIFSYDEDGLRNWNIPNGHIFVRGDNPENGFDSLVLGPIPISNIFGIVIKKL